MECRLVRKVSSITLEMFGWKFILNYENLFNINQFLSSFSCSFLLRRRRRGRRRWRRSVITRGVK
jgi:hypothetical protein